MANIIVPKGSSPSAPDQRAKLLGLLFMLAIFASFKLLYNPIFNGGSGDSLYYFQQARHVANGEGFLTSVAFDDEGFRSLPRPAISYPLWPVVLGTIGSLVPLEWLSRALPELLYLVGLTLIYFLVEIYLRRTSSAALPCLRVGAMEFSWSHTIVALLGFNQNWFIYSSLPYTEPLAYCCLFGSLILVFKFAESKSLPLALCAALLAVCTYLTRFQFVLFPIFIFVALLWIARRQPYWASFASLLLITIIIPVGLWALYVRSVTDYFSIKMLIQAADYHETPILSHVGHFLYPTSLYQMVKEIIISTAISLNPVHPHSYIRAFGPIALVVPLAAIIAIYRSIPKFERPNWQTIFVVGCALCSLLPLHISYRLHYRPYFAWAYGLPFVLLLFLAVVYLQRNGGIIKSRWLVIVLGLSIAWEAFGGLTEIMNWPLDKPSAAQIGASDWIVREDISKPILSTRAGFLTVLSGVSSHTLACYDSIDQVKRYFESGLITRLVVLPEDRHCVYYNELKNHLQLVHPTGEGSQDFEVYSEQN